MKDVAILGAGLIGGSIARDLAALGVRVLVHDRDPETVAAAIDEGVAQALAPSLEEIESMATIVLALPVGADVEIIDSGALSNGNALVLDMASVQTPACSAAVRAGIGHRFCGSHPIAGDHRAGWHASRRGLFQDGRVRLCPTDNTAPPRLAAARAFWAALGATTIVTTPEEHDRLLAWASHLPQTLSSALALALARAGVSVEALGPGGRDVARLAQSSADVWVPILLANAEAIETALDGAIVEITHVRDALHARDEERLRRALEQAAEWHGG